ncbi:MAG: NAD(P)/FAD-dependent oxidoreductase [Deltaproteobacteria bacterium]|nr:NAD(P)/FAD-dependent oxidoreductase [Deltaproteobacteria bacterium]MCB9789077.1 NAD(P)/FAD-dependent oxidoreductase [Deltaproteobacteria bacterium]
MNSRYHALPGPPDRSRARARTPLPERVDVAVVGAGLGGLAAAAKLAARGLRVAVLDAHYTAGGCATVFARGPRDARYHFDVGLHYVGDCGPGGQMTELLDDLGVAVDWLPLDPDGFDTFVFPELTFAVPADLDRYRDRLVALFPKEQRGIDRYVRFVREVRHIGTRVERNRGRMSPRVLWEVLLRGRLLARYQGATLAALLDTCTREPLLRAIIAGQNGDYGLPPSEVSALLHAGLAAHYFQGAYYPRGGGQVIADRLAARIESLGGTIHLRTPVERILVEGGRAAGVVTEASRHGETHTLRADLVVSGADLKHTLLDMVGPEHLPSSLIRHTSEQTMPAALFMTFLGLTADMRAKGMRASNVWSFPHADMEALYRHAREAAEPQPDVAYITSASMKDPDNPHHAPPGVTNVEVMTLVSGDPRCWGLDAGDPIRWDHKHNPRYQAIKERVEARMVACLERVFPGSAESIVYRESATPLTHTRFTRASDGSAYGLAATPGQFMRGRPGYRTPIAGLYLCGASTRAGHGIIGALSSGRAAAGAVLSDHPKAGVAPAR